MSPMDIEDTAHGRIQSIKNEQESGCLECQCRWRKGEREDDRVSVWAERIYKDIQVWDDKTNQEGLGKEDQCEEALSSETAEPRLWAMIRG